MVHIVTHIPGYSRLHGVRIIKTPSAEYYVKACLQDKKEAWKAYESLGTTEQEFEEMIREVEAKFQVKIKCEEQTPSFKVAKPSDRRKEVYVTISV